MLLLCLFEAKSYDNVHKAERLPEAKRGEPCLFSMWSNYLDKRQYPFTSIGKNVTQLTVAASYGVIRRPRPKISTTSEGSVSSKPLATAARWLSKVIIKKLEANGLLAQLLLATDQWLPCIDIIAVSKESNEN
jgi:hypothetical protein